MTFEGALKTFRDFVKAKFPVQVTNLHNAGHRRGPHSVNSVSNNRGRYYNRGGRSCMAVEVIGVAEAADEEEEEVVDIMVEVEVVKVEEASGLIDPRQLLE